MVTGDRLPDQNFDAAESLFYRFDQPGELGTRPSGLQLRNPDFSVNRQKHGGTAAHVLLPNYGLFGVVSFMVGSELAEGLRKCRHALEDGRVLRLDVWHAPVPLNYFHCNAGGVLDEVPLKKRAADASYRVLRQILAESSMIVVVSKIEM